MAYQLERLTPRRKLLWSGIAVMIVSAGALVYHVVHRTAVSPSVGAVSTPSMTARVAAVPAVTGPMARGAQGPNGRWPPGIHEYVVAPGSLVSTISVAGTIVPGNSVDILAPFDGIVRQVSFTYGQGVVKNQILLTMDTADAEHQLRVAEVAYLKAADAERDMEHWTSGLEVQRAERTKSAAEASLAATHRKMEQTKSLLDRGLVPRAEYEDLLEQEQAQRRDLASATDELRHELNKGNGAARSVAMIDLADAKAALEDKRHRIGNAVVRAGAAGILSRPSSGSDDKSATEIHAGTRLSQGELVARIANQASLGVAFHLSEEDADRVQEGQRVTVTGPGFPSLAVTGHVAVVAAAANSSVNDSSMFDGTVILDGLTPEQARMIRLGMSANATIYLRDSSNVISVPPQAILQSGTGSIVEVQEPGSKRLIKVVVRTGDVEPDRVEIISGLKPGDIVVWRDSSGSK